MDMSCTHFSYDKIFKQGQLQLPSADILQVAELSLIKNGEIYEHVQHCDEITYVVSGKATIYSGEKSFELGAKQIHYIKQGEKHRIIADLNDDFHYYCIGFTPNIDYQSISVFFEKIKDLDSFVIDDKSNILSVFDLLINELYNFDDESKSMMNSYFCQMIILLYRILTKKTKTFSKTNVSTSNQVVYQTLKYVDRHYVQLEKIKDIADNLSYSEYYLSHTFKKIMGITIKSYITQKKIAMAAELLKNSNMTIGEISEHLHFFSTHSFGIAFKQYMNISPSEFRKANKQK